MERLQPLEDVIAGGVGDVGADNGTPTGSKEADLASSPEKSTNSSVHTSSLLGEERWHALREEWREDSGMVVSSNLGGGALVTPILLMRGDQFEQPVPLKEIVGMLNDTWSQEMFKLVM